MPNANMKLGVIRLVTVPTPQDCGFLASSLPTFERETGIRVTVFAIEDTLDYDRSGRTEIAIAPYGHEFIQ